MTAKVKYEIEYPLRTSAKVLYKRLSTSSGLSEWFADNVTERGGVYTFEWNGNKQKAEQFDRVKHEKVKYKWLHETNEDLFFGFELEVEEITNDLTLIVMDYAEEDEIDDNIELWDKQIKVLKRKLGI